MPQLSFQVTNSGLAVSVLIGLDGKTTAALHAAQMPIAPPIQARGLLDTGSNVTAIASWIVQQLALRPATTTVSHTAGGPIKVDLIEVSLSITDQSVPGSPWLTQPDLLAMELKSAPPDADVLIGLDILLISKLLLDGPARQFSLSF